MGVEKVSRQAVILLRQRNPLLTLQEIGQEAPILGGWGEPITRERVRQILVAAQRQTASLPERRNAHCHMCGMSSREVFLMPTTFTLKGKKVRRCEECQKRVKVERTEKACEICRKPLERRSQKTCSTRCRAKLLAKRKSEYALKKWQHIFKKYRGMGVTFLAKRLKVSRTTIQRAIKKIRASA